MCPIGPHNYTVEVDNEYFTEDTYPAGRMECTPYVLCRGMHARTEYEGLGLIISTSVTDIGFNSLYWTPYLTR